MKIFLSYAFADREWVTELASMLQTAGIEVTDRESGYRLGDDIDQFFRESIGSAELIVPIITERWSHSPNALFELGAARAMGKQMLPLVIMRKELSTQVPEFLADQNFVRVESSQEAVEQIKRFAMTRMAGV